MPDVILSALSILTFNLHNPMKQLPLLAPFSRWEHLGTEKVGNWA